MEIEFNFPSEENPCQLFSTELENDPNVLFHGAPENSALSIIENGVHPTGSLRRISYGSRKLQRYTAAF